MRGSPALWLLALLAASVTFTGLARAATQRGDVLLDEAPVQTTIQLRPGPAAEAPANAPEPVSGNPLWSIPLRALSATRERPIFLPSRRPPAAVVNVPVAAPMPIPVAPPAEPEPLTLKLVGTIANRSFGIALFTESASLGDDPNRPLVRLRRGEAHAGWVLREIRQQEVSLEKGDRIETLVFPRPDKAAALRATEENNAAASLARFGVKLTP